MKTSIKKIVSVVICTAALSAVVQAQVYPVLNVPGPEVGTLGVVHTVPVGHYTGTPNISIPLYDVKVGNFSLPITANYHLASVKPHTPPTSLGTGWALDAGGYIARNVRGLCDERCDRDGKALGYYAYCHKLKNITDNEFATLTTKEAYGEDGHEMSADEFSFNFCGYSGNFYLSPSGEWTVVSDHDIKVEFDNQSGFTNFDEIVKKPTYGNEEEDIRIIGDWLNQQDCYRAYSKFTLITPDGCRYEFGGIPATEYSISYYNRHNAELVPSSWRLSRIVTPEKRTIDFTYDTSSIMVNIRYAPQYNFTVGESEYAEGGNWGNGRSEFAGFLIFPVSLKKIETPTEILDFTLFRNSYYPNRYNDNSHALYWAMKIPSTLTPQEMENIFVPFFDLLNVGVEPDDNENSIRNKIAEKLRHLMLHRILIQSKSEPNTYGVIKMDTVRSIYFDYTDHEFPMLKSITMRPDAPNTGLKHNAQPIVPEAATPNRPPSYHFSYNGGLPEQPILIKTDPWGYNRGTKYRLADFISGTEEYPAPIEKAQKGTLSQIIYPTGARTSFVYELHDFSKQVSSDRVILESYPIPKKSGGLRVSEIIEKDRLNKTINRRKYYYTNTLTPVQGSKSSGISSGNKIMTVTLQLGSSGYTKKMSTEPFGIPVTNFNTPDVGYSSVTEEMIDAEDNTLGLIRYHYSNFDADIYGDEHMDEPYSMSVGVTGGVFPTAPFTSRAAERGKLLSKEYYNAQKQLIKKENFRYDWTDDGYIDVAHWHLESAPDPDPLYLIDNRQYYVAGWRTKIYTGSYLPIEKKETEYYQPGNKTFTRETFYSYNKNKMLAKDSTMSSSNTPITTSYTYVCDTDGYDWMQSQHILSPLVKKTIKNGNASQHESFEYELSNSIPYLSKKYSWTNNQTPKLVYEVQSTDHYGNPTTIIENGVFSTLSWGFRGLKLVCRTILSADNRNLHYFYNYNDKLQLINAIEPGKPKLWYDYDYLGRLKEIYYNDYDPSGSSGQDYIRKIVKRFKYDYRYVVGM